MALVRSLANLAPQGGTPGAVIAEPSDAPRLDEALRTNVFRRGLIPASSRQHIWHLLVFAVGCLFLVDVFNRRVLVRFSWVRAAASRLRASFASHERTETKSDAIERLRSQKSRVHERLDSRPGALRSQTGTAPDEIAATQATLVETGGDSGKDSERTDNLTPQADEQDYTSRLLKAKQRVWQERRSQNCEIP